MSTIFRHTQVEISRGSIHVVESGSDDAPPMVLLHGWPEDWSAWSSIMRLVGPEFRCIALDLPGIGSSTLDHANGEKEILAGVVHEVIDRLGLRDITLVGHDVGGMVVYSYLPRYTGVVRSVIMDTVIPGIEPWNSVLANPYIWHFAFQSIPALPELLVSHELEAYFNYFYDTIAAHPEAISAQARNRYIEAYRAPGSLTQGFDFYRAFSRDAAANVETRSIVTTPMLYLRGSAEGGDINDYARGFEASGIENLTIGTIPDSGHFAPEEAPTEVWKAISAFAQFVAEPTRIAQ